jgi:hypothetical protein
VRHRRWVSELGWEEAITLLEANNADPTYAVRASGGRGKNPLGTLLKPF